MTDNTDRPHGDGPIAADAEAADLLRRTFASREPDVDDARAAELMTELDPPADGAGRGPRGGGRLWPVLFGVAAACALLLAVLAGGIVTGRIAPPWAATPQVAGPTEVRGARLLTEAEDEALSARVRKAWKEAGTVSVRLGWAPSQAGTAVPTTGPTPMSSDGMTMVLDFDVRGPEPAVRTVVSAPGTDDVEGIAIGDDTWQRESGVTPDGVWVHSRSERWDLLTPLLQTDRDDVARSVWSLGDDGVGEHLVVMTDGSGKSGQVPAMSTDTAGPLQRTDLWVDAAGRIVRAEVFEDGDPPAVFDEFRYGADIRPITPPPPAQVVEEGSPAATSAPTVPPGS